MPKSVKTPAKSARRERWEQMVNRRLGETLHQMQTLALLADRLRYTEIYQSDIDYICEELSRETERTVDKFRAGSKRPVARLPNPD